MATIEDAIIVATVCHDGQKDKLGKPYILHPLRVMQAVMEAVSDDHSRRSTDSGMVAVLHDVIEDTGLDINVIRNKFGPRVATRLLILTKRPDETYGHYIGTIQSQSGIDPVLRVIKIKDIEDNLGRIPELSKTDEATARRLVKKYGNALIQLGVPTATFGDTVSRLWRG